MIRVTHSIKTPDSASEISNTPSGTISSTNVQDAINELDGDVAALDASLGTAAVEDVGTSGHTLPFLDGANTWSDTQGHTAGINLGSAVAPGGVDDLSRHIALFGTTYGFSVTSSSLNYVASTGAAHNWYSSSSRLMTLDATSGLNIPRVGTAQAIEISGGDAGGVYIKCLSAGGAAKVIHYNSTTDSSDSAPSGGANGHQFEIRGVDALSITDDRIIVLNSGQLQFPASQNASSDANTLDDYEEGTFTPTITGSTTAGTGTYSNQTGLYTKVGNVVHVLARCTWSAHTGTGTLRLSSLPFTVSTLAAPAAIRTTGITYTGMLQAFGQGTNVVLEQLTEGGLNSAIAMDSAGDFIVSVSYRT